jgi:hypothetical protein
MIVNNRGCHIVPMRTRDTLISLKLSRREAVRLDMVALAVGLSRSEFVRRVVAHATAEPASKAEDVRGERSSPDRAEAAP